MDGRVALTENGMQELHSGTIPRLGHGIFTKNIYKKELLF